MGKVGKILLAVVQIGAIIALNVYAPGIGSALSSALGGAISVATATSIVIGIGTAIIALGGAVLSAALFKVKSDFGRQKVNVRVEEATRWIVAGPVLQGGAALFAEHDASGNLWFVIVHADSILQPGYTYYFDNQLITVNEATREVTSTDFVDDGKTYWRVWTHTYSETDPTPTASTELQAAFPDKWSTLSHMLVGTTYSVVCGQAVKLKNRYKVYKWRGALGLGEPNIAIFGDWSNMYDPRDNTQILGNRATYKKSRNSALIWAWWRTHPFGREKAESDINWTRVGQQASICDETVVGIETTQKRYECAIGAQDSVDRSIVENQIMLSCDGQLVFDDDGRTWMNVGKYYAPNLSISRNRDIITMSSVEAQDGESETQGVVVRFIDHNANFAMQPSAAWYNPIYYVAGKGNTFLSIDIPTIFNHNQAMRVAKGIGLRSQPPHKLAPVVGLRGLRAMQERILNLDYDNQFAGDYELAAPVDVDESGVFCSLGLVPINADRWTLLAGEEKPRPNSTSSGGTGSLSLPTGVIIAYNNNRIEASFDPPLRDDVNYEFQYIKQSDWTGSDDDRWSNMSTDMDVFFAYSGVIDRSLPQYVRWRTVSNGGASTAWFDPPYLLNPQVDPLAPSELVTVTPSAGQAVVAWKNPNDLRFYMSDIWRGTTTVFSAATKIMGNYSGGVGQPQGITDTIAAGKYYYWVQAKAADGTTALPTGPVSGVIT